MTGKILVLTAIDDELDTARAPEGVEVIYSGVGKVNAASASTLSLRVLRPSLVINYGTAGKINEQLRGLVEVAHVVQRDMMAMPLAPRGRTPFSSDLDRLSSGHGDVICGTGDSFVTSSDPWLNENNINMSASVTLSLGARSSSSQTTLTTSPPSTGPPMSPTDRSCFGMR